MAVKLTESFLVGFALAGLPSLFVYIRRVLSRSVHVGSDFDD